MPRNKVQFQKGLSEAEFNQRQGSEEQCHEALVKWRSPNGFECPDCGCGAHCAVTRGARKLFQCKACRKQTSVRAGTIFAASKLPLLLWFAIDPFRRIRAVRNQTVGRGPLHPFTVNRVLKRAAQAADLSSHQIERFSGHSMRVGAAQNMIVSGLSILPIMQAGGWRSMNVVGRYVENANLNSLLEKARAAMRISR